MMRRHFDWYGVDANTRVPVSNLSKDLAKAQGVLQCVVVCCSVLQRVAVCCRVLQGVAVCCSLR